MIVLDASAAAAAVLALLNDGDARRSLASQTVAVPHLVDSEVAHALRGQAIRGSVGAAGREQRQPARSATEVVDER